MITNGHTKPGRPTQFYKAIVTPCAKDYMERGRTRKEMEQAFRRWQLIEFGRIASTRVERV